MRRIVCDTGGWVDAEVVCATTLCEVVRVLGLLSDKEIGEALIKLMWAAVKIQSEAKATETQVKVRLH